MAFAAKRHWGYPERWIAHWHSLLTITPAAMAADEAFVACEGDRERIVGFATLQEEAVGGILRLNHPGETLPAEMGRGIGRALFREAEAQQRARARGFATFEIGSDPMPPGFMDGSARSIHAPTPPCSKAKFGSCRFFIAARLTRESAPGRVARLDALKRLAW